MVQKGDYSEAFAAPVWLAPAERVLDRPILPAVWHMHNRDF